MALITIEAFEDSVDTGWSGTLAFATARFGKGLSFGSGQNASYTLPTAVTGFVCGFAQRFTALPGTNSGMAFNNSAGSQMAVAIQQNGKYGLFRGGVNATLLASSTTTFVINSWNYIEVKCNGFTDAGGTCQVRINGALEIDFAGDTLLTAASPASLTQIVPNSATSNTLLYDDLYLLDLTGSAPYNDYLGDCRVEQLLPTGAGATTQWTPSGTGGNFAQVDETPPNSTDYVGSATSGQRDLYAMSDLGSTSGTVLAVRPVFNLAKSDTGADPGVRAVLRGGDGTVRTQTTLPPQSITYVTRPGVIETTQPNGSAWSITDVNALQVGQEIV